MVWNEVTGPGQLWRFQTGHIRGTRSLTAGDQHVVFKTKHRGWLRAEANGVLSSGHTLEGREDKFVVEFLEEGGHVALKTWHGSYWSVQPNTQRLTANSAAVGEREKFRLYIDNDEEHVVLKSCDGHWVTVEPDGRVEANHGTIPTREGWEMLRGWRKGSPAEWTPYEGMPYWQTVTRDSQLWRFRTGHVDGGRACVTADGHYVVLLSARGKWLSTNNKSETLTNDRSKTDRAEKFEVDFLDGDGNFVAVKCSNGLYLSALHDGRLEANRDSVGETERFKMYTDAGGEQLALQTGFGHWIGVTPGGQVRADSDTLDKSCVFRGWKKGSQDDWKPRDQWELVGFLDNRGKEEPGQLRYVKTVGVSLEQADALTVSQATALEADPALVQAFTAGLLKQATDFNWATSGGDTWQKAVTSQATWSAPPGKRMALQQPRGSLGPFVIRPEHFILKEQ